MVGLDGDKAALRFLVAAIVAELASLALPWWTLTLTIEGRLVSSFNLFLWGPVSSGFSVANLQFEWWSYATFALILASVFLGIGAYRFLKRNRQSARALVGFETAVTICGYVLYVSGLLFTFTSSFKDFESYWITYPAGQHGSFAIGAYSPFYFNFYDMFNGVLLEFLSIGFFLATTASILSMITLYRLGKRAAQTARAFSLS